MFVSLEDNNNLFLDEENTKLKIQLALDKHNKLNRVTGIKIDQNKTYYC